MFAVRRESAVKPAIEAKLFGTRISRTSWPALKSEKSSWFFVSSAKIVTRSASTRSRTRSLMSTRISGMPRGGVDGVGDLDELPAVGELALGRLGHGHVPRLLGAGPPDDVSRGARAVGGYARSAGSA